MQEGSSQRYLMLNHQILVW